MSKLVNIYSDIVKLTLEYEFKKAPSETQFKENKVLYSKKYQNCLRIPSKILTRH